MAASRRSTPRNHRSRRCHRHRHHRRRRRPRRACCPRRRCRCRPLPANSKPLPRGTTIALAAYLATPLPAVAADASTAAIAATDHVAAKTPASAAAVAVAMTAAIARWDAAPPRSRRAAADHPPSCHCGAADIVAVDGNDDETTAQPCRHRSAARLPSRPRRDARAVLAGLSRAPRGADE